MTADHDELETSVAAFVLGALEDQEAEEVRRHLETCPTCPTLADGLRRAVGVLPLGVEPAPPPAHLRDRILAAAGVAASTPAVRDRPAVVPVRRDTTGRWVRWRPASAAAAAIIAFALGAGLGLGIGRTTAPPLPSTSVAQFTMSGTGQMEGAHGSVFELRREGVTFVQFSGLPPIASDRVYELWLIPASGQPVPGAVFAPDLRGGQVVVLGHDLAGYKALAVTEEAAPTGASAPTQQPQLSGALG
jgi:anti-sigma-K factor RskA